MESNFFHISKLLILIDVLQVIAFDKVLLLLEFQYRGFF